MSDASATLMGRLETRRAPAYTFDSFARRAIDIAASVLLLIFLGPLLITVMLLIKLQDGGPAIFAQERIGQGGKTFKCFKLRSMQIDAAQRLAHLLATDPAAKAEWDRDQKLRRDPRITMLGGFLRKSSIDEFPQLVNVLRGEMSLVGPRPIVRAEVARYGRWFRNYAMVKPGITGLWQVNGRNHTTYQRRVALDVVYSRTNSLALYVKILLLTIPAVLFSRGSF
jgi:exopolysaccharide production protein ExoY